MRSANPIGRAADRAMTRIALAGPSPLVTKAGDVVGEMGGNVADVAVAATLTACCVEPGVCGPAAGGFLTIDLPGQSPVVVDGYMAVPGLGFRGETSSRIVEMIYGGGTTTVVGAGSVAVPGIFSALDLVSTEFGRVPWRDTMAVVAEIVDAGFPMTRSAWDYMTEGGDAIYGEDPATRAAMFRGDDVAPVGETLLFEGLGDTLRLIGDEGAEVFHRGELGRAIVEDLQARGSALTRADLETYEVVLRAPLEVEIAGWRMMTNPAPAVGGAALALALGAIAQADDPLNPTVWLGALRASFEARVNSLELAVDRGAAIGSALARAGLRSPSTISVAAMDDEGGGVASTFSAGYGAGVIPAGTGLLMNNGMGEVELNPGDPGEQKSGDRLMSNMAPTILGNGKHSVAVASPGADRITTALTITLARLALAGDSITDAIEHPRVHPRPDGFALEPGLQIDIDGVEVRRFAGPNMYFGGVVGAAWDGSLLSAHSDRRRGGAITLID